MKLPTRNSEIPTSEYKWNTTVLVTPDSKHGSGSLNSPMAASCQVNVETGGLCFTISKSRIPRPQKRTKWETGAVDRNIWTMVGGNHWDTAPKVVELHPTEILGDGEPAGRGPALKDSDVRRGRRNERTWRENWGVKTPVVDPRTPYWEDWLLQIPGTTSEISVRRRTSGGNT